MFLANQEFLAKAVFGSVLGSEVFGSEVLDQGVLGADSEHTEHALPLLLPGVAHQAGVGGVQWHREERTWNRRDRLKWRELADFDTINLAQLCMLHAGHPVHRVEEHVGVELKAEGELVVAVHVHDARGVPRAAQAHLQ